MARHCDQERVTPLAIADYRGSQTRFGIKQKDRSGHLYVLGKTGTGKSTFIKNMIVRDLEDGSGLAVIDPHGDLAEDILNFIPKRRLKDVIYFNPADQAFPVGFNPLEQVHAASRHLVSSGLISVFKKIWHEFWGPRMEHILRNTILSLLDYPASTLLDVPRMLTDKDFRLRVLATIDNSHVKDFWFKEFDRYSPYLRSEAIAPILNKIGQFLSAPLIHNIIGQPKSAFTMRTVMDEGRLLIVNLAKGRIGEDACSLFGAMIITKLQLAALSRVDTTEARRAPFYLYIDEIHSFMTLSFTDILSEARKYGLYLILTHQYIDQLDEKIRGAVFGNVGTIVSFRLGQQDALIMAREFYPVFDESDLVNLANYRIYLKLMIDGATSQAFSAAALAPPISCRSYKEKIINLSRQIYARPQALVEQQLLVKRAEEENRPVKKYYEQKLPFF